MEALIIILSLAFLLLNVILFFKIWGMTNDVAAIRQLLQNGGKIQSSLSTSSENTERPHPNVTFQKTDASPINIGDLVVDIKTEKQMRVHSIKDGQIEGYRQGKSCGFFSLDEILPFEEYVRQLNQ